MESSPPRLVLKQNDRMSKGVCALCGFETKLSAGPELFVEGSWDPVCLACARRREPALAALVTLASGVNECLRHLKGTPSGPDSS
ncbi:MAG: hypothetical protein Kow0092_07160 [Deferrisomatales bacterium]